MLEVAFFLVVLVVVCYDCVLWLCVCGCVLVCECVLWSCVVVALWLCGWALAVEARPPVNGGISSASMNMQMTSLSSAFFRR